MIFTKSNKLAKLRRHASRVHFAKIHFGKIHYLTYLTYLVIIAKEVSPEAMFYFVAPP